MIKMTYDEMARLMMASKALLHEAGGGMVILPQPAGRVAIVHDLATADDKIAYLGTGASILMRQDKLSRTDVISRLNERLKETEKHNMQIGVMT